MIGYWIIVVEIWQNGRENGIFIITEPMSRKLLRFYEEYQSVQRLSSFSWRLLYARMLFPIHYVECIENYYSSQSEQEQRMLTERLEKFLQGSNDYEKFLGNFFQIVSAPVRQQHIPLLDWL